MHNCPKCLKPCRTITDLERHLNRKFPCDAGKEKCTECAQTFSSKQTLKVHHESGACNGKPAGLVAQELAQENLTLRRLLEQQSEFAQKNDSGTVAASSVADTQALLTEQADANLQQNSICSHASQLSVDTSAASVDLLHRVSVSDLAAASLKPILINHSNDEATLQHPPLEIPEFVYAVWSNGNRTIKAGRWKGTLKGLRQRYVTILGKNMQLMLFQCENRVMTERLMFKKLKQWHIESELYSIDCLSILPTAILSLSSVSDTVQRSEHTSGGYIFSKPQVLEDAPLSERFVATTAPVGLVLPVPSETETEVLRLNLEKLKVRRQKLELQEQQLALREQELVIEEQLVHSK